MSLGEVGRRGYASVWGAVAAAAADNGTAGECIQCSTRQSRLNTHEHLGSVHVGAAPRVRDLYADLDRASGGSSMR